MDARSLLNRSEFSYREALNRLGIEYEEYFREDSAFEDWADCEASREVNAAFPEWSVCLHVLDGPDLYFDDKGEFLGSARRVEPMGKAAPAQFEYYVANGRN